MKHLRHLPTIASAACLTLLAIAPAAPAGIKNGNFERGNLSGWTAKASKLNPEQSVAEWRVYSNGQRVLSPQLGESTLPTPRGKYASVFVQSGPSNGALSQAFRVGAAAKYLKLEVFWINQAGDSPPPEPTSASTEPRGDVVPSIWPFAGNFGLGTPGGPYTPPLPENQYFSIDLVSAGAGAFATKKRAVLARGFAPTSSTAPTSGGWKKVRIPLRNLRGKRVKLRLAAVDNLYYLNVGLDSVRIVNGPKPDPVTG